MIKAGGTVKKSPGPRSGRRWTAALIGTGGGFDLRGQAYTVLFNVLPGHQRAFYKEALGVGDNHEDHEDEPQIDKRKRSFISVSHRAYSSSSD